MKHQSQYIVIYKDSHLGRNKYFGPFVSVTMAEEFRDTLPEPLEGGYRLFKAVQPYTHEEASLARDVIIRQREVDLLDVIQDIVSTHEPPLSVN